MQARLHHGHINSLKYHAASSTMQTSTKVDASPARIAATCCLRTFRQERQDGTNVNAWHWTEKDVSGWTKQRLGEVLSGLQLFSDASGSAATIELEAVKGERRLWASNLAIFFQHLG